MSEITIKHRNTVSYLCRIDDEHVLVRGLGIRLVHDFGDVLRHSGGRVELLDEYQFIGYGQTTDYDTIRRVCAVRGRWVGIAVKRDRKRRAPLYTPRHMP